MTRPMMGFGLQNQEETHRREFESPPGYHRPTSTIPGAEITNLKETIAPLEIMFKEAMKKRLKE